MYGKGIMIEGNVGVCCRLLNKMRTNVFDES